jgi:hypothetical protein
MSSWEEWYGDSGYKSRRFPQQQNEKESKQYGTRRYNKAGETKGNWQPHDRKDQKRRGERVGSLGAEYFKDTRAEAAQNSPFRSDGEGTGSITITPTRKGYSKTGGGSRMNISEKATTKWVSGNVHGDTYETQHPSVKMRTTGEVVVPRHKEVSRHPFVMRTQGGRDIPKDKWEREKYWGTFSEVTRKYKK